MGAELHVFDLATGVPRGHVEASRVKWWEGLNAQLDLSFRLDLARKPARELAPFIRSGATQVVLYDPPVVRSFVVWERSYTGRRFLKVRGSGLWSWFEQRPIDRRFRFNAADQHNIAADLIEWAQRGGGVGVGVDVAPSGVLRDRTYNGFEWATVGERVAELAAVSGGFEFGIVTEFDGARRVSDTWRAFYPRAGTRWPASAVQVDLDGTAIDLDVDEVAPATRQVELGAGEGGAMLVGSHSESLGSAYPPLWRIEGRKTVTRQRTLDGHAAADLRRYNAGVQVWSPTILDRHGVGMALTVGDECQVTLGQGDYLYPDGIETVRRVVGRSVEISDKGGPDRVTLDLESVAA